MAKILDRSWKTHKGTHQREKAKEIAKKLREKGNRARIEDTGLVPWKFARKLYFVRYKKK